jgi:predicted TIM-barrel fold metal-dependent hydrolase
MIIDVYCHYISPRVGALLSTNKYYGKGKQFNFPEQNSDPQVRLGLMDKYGVDIQALSQTTPVLLGFRPEEAAEICRFSNDDNFALCKAYPKRFVNVGIVSLLDVKEAIKEVERCVNELDCRGITIATNQDGKGLDAPEYFPFYEKAEKYGLPLFLHPTHWESYPLVDMEQGWRMMHVFGWPFDTSQAVWRMIFGGVLDHYPTLKVVTHHLGAMLPFFSRRVEQNVIWALKGKLPRPITEYWKNLWGDTAVDGTTAAYPCGYAFFGPDRMMYGSDYPFGNEFGEDFIRSNLEGVKAMKIPQKNIKKILGGNAQDLLKIKA